MKHAVILKSICFFKKYILTKKTVNLLLLFILAYSLGAAAGSVKKHFSSAASSSSFPEEKSAAVSAEGNWGLSFQEDGQPPVGNADFEELAQYDAYYAEDTDEKVLYLTFDAGYENGNTEAILDALKKHGVQATFFVVGTYIESEPDLICRMVEEGHTVGNHTWHHPDMSQMATMDVFRKELEDVEGLELVGSLKYNIEINARGVNKGTGLVNLGRILGIRREEIMACGDGDNDTAMMREAGFGVAMENAEEQVKQAADYITSGNEDEGAAKAIEKFVLNQ